MYVFGKVLIIIIIGYFNNKYYAYQNWGFMHYEKEMANF